MKTQTNFEATYTDTFGGEPNYAWVRRATFSAASDASDRELLSKAKKALDLQGIKGRILSGPFADELTYKPDGMHTILFIQTAIGGN